MIYLSPLDALLNLVSPNPSGLESLTTDWEALVDTAERHALVPLLHARLEPILDRLPPAVQESLQRAYTDSAAHTIFFEFALESIIEAFRREQIPLVAYKGIPLARMLYDDSAVRLAGDIDVMVPTADLERCQVLLEQEGWQHERTWEIHLNYVKKMGGTEIPLEVHWVSQREGEYHIPHMRFWEEAFETEAGWTFSREMTLLIIVLHCARHFFVPYRQMVDIAHAVAQWNETLDWERIVALANEAHATPMLATVLALAHRDLGAPLPKHATLVQLMASWRIRMTIRYLSVDHLLGEPLFSALDRYFVPLLNGAWHPARLILHDFLPPPELVVYRYDVSPNSRWIPLYTILRPLRLLGKHLRQRFSYKSTEQKLKN
ncbi:MAG: nucleotidyltransferase domain-containing protein [Ardenticatenaceae bacterium]